MAAPALRRVVDRLRPKGRAGFVLRVVQVVALVGAVVWLVVPRLGDTADVLGLIGDMAVMPLVVGSLLGLASVYAYAEVTRVLLPRASRPRRRRALGVVFSALGVNRVAPLGMAAGSAVTFGLLCREGVPRADAAFAMAVQGIGSAIVLQVLLWSSALAIAPVDGFVPLTLAAVVVGAVVLGVVGLGLWGLTRHREATTRRLVGLARRLRKGSERAVPPLVAGIGARLDRLGRDRATMLRSSAWAAANWLADAASLWVFLVAFGAEVSPLQALVAFGVANVVATVPVTPGGIGVVETTLALALIALGAPAQAAFLGVAGYRLVHFWLPIPGGLVAFLALRLSGRRTAASHPLPVPAP